MSDSGACAEPRCAERSARLFDCVHHCQKALCLQHLIEHDRLIEPRSDGSDRHRLELQQLWLTYASLIDETKLRRELEEKLKNHQQLTEEIACLFEMNSSEAEDYRLMIEKIKLNLEQVHPVKLEPAEMIATQGAIDTLEINLATHPASLNNHLCQQPSTSTSSTAHHSSRCAHANLHSPSLRLSALRTFSCECPFWSDGAFGLRTDPHGMYLCPARTHLSLFDHLLDFHKLSKSAAERICRALLAGKDPSTELLFQSSDVVIDKRNNYFCPFSIHNPQRKRLARSSRYSCRRTKPIQLRRLRSHFRQDHHMSAALASSFVKKLKRIHCVN